MTAKELYDEVMKSELCIRCGSPEEARTVLRFFDEHGTRMDPLIRRIAYDEEPEDTYKNYPFAGRTQHGDRKNITLFCAISDRPCVNYEEVRDVVERGLTSAWVASTDFAALLV